MAFQQDKMTRYRMENAILGFVPMVTLDPKITSDDVRHIIRVFMRKHPEIFWFTHQYHYDEKTGVLRLKYNFTREKAHFFKGEIEKVIKDDFQIDYVRSLSEIERLVYVYKWIAKRTTYNEYSSYNQTIYSVLINRNSVCTGYAKTAQYLLNLVGIESELVFGKFHSDKSEHGRHGWNIVKIEDAWYHVDFCLADASLSYLLNKDESPNGNNSILWNYFGVPTARILSNRSIEFIEILPECNGTLSGFPNVELPKPRKQLICCKSDSGTSSRIYLDSFNNNRVIKVPKNNQTELLNNEAAILSKLSDCPHVIKSYGLHESGLSLEQLTPWSELLCSHYYNPTDSDLRNILRQLIEGLIECRDRGILHSDIHYNNVFVTRNWTYKWGDFGIAFHNQPNGKLPPEMIGEDGKAKGSYWFMSPETYLQNVFTEVSAIYSVAMMAYFVMNNMRPPFWTDEEHAQEALAQRLNGRTIHTPKFADRYEDLWPIIQGALSYSIESRPRSFEDFINQLDRDVFIIEDNPIVESECSPTEIDDKNYPIPIDVDGDGCGDGGIHDSDTFACTCGIVDCEEVPLSRDDFAKTTIANINPMPHHEVDSCPPSYPAPSPRPVKKSSPNRTSKHCPASIAPQCGQSIQRETYGVTESMTNSRPIEKLSLWNRLFGKKTEYERVSATAYAPAEVVPCRYFIVRVFIHKPKESRKIAKAVKDVDKDAVKKANKSLEIPVKDGDKITVKLSITDGVTIDEPIQNIVWKGHYMECDFGCQLTERNVYSLLGHVIVAINNIPKGDLRFTLDVVPTETSKVYAPVETRRYSKIFISYAHADYLQVRGIAEGCKMNGSDYFFDRHSLQAGDIFKDKILQYIDNADLFVLCWSKNAAESEWVQIERKHALELIEQGNHQLAIYPLSMPPEAPLPADMSDKYNFATL